MNLRKGRAAVYGIRKRDVGVSRIKPFIFCNMENGI